MPNVVVDWDGTLVANEWPDKPTHIADEAIEAMREMLGMGYRVLVYTSRLHPQDYHTGTDVHWEKLDEEVAYIRRTLDDANLHFVEIYDEPGKPGAVMYIDDKGRQFTGDVRQWDEFVEELRAMLETPTQEFVI